MYTNLSDLLLQSGQSLESLEQPRVQMPNSIHQVPLIDVHQFDYSYSNQHHKLVELPNESKREWIQRLIDKMSNPSARQGAHLILANIGMEANRDTTNQKSAEDLLVLLSQYIFTKDESFLFLVEEQLSDMLYLGQCAQGRTTRLWQLYVALPQ
jgi:hypothetical protein